MQLREAELKDGELKQPHHNVTSPEQQDGAGGGARAAGCGHALGGGGGGAGVGRGGEARVPKQLMKQMPAAFRDILLLLHSPVLH